MKPSSFQDDIWRIYCNSCIFETTLQSEVTSIISTDHSLFIVSKRTILRNTLLQSGIQAYALLGADGECAKILECIFFVVRQKPFVTIVVETYSFSYIHPFWWRKLIARLEADKKDSKLPSKISSSKRQLSHMIQKIDRIWVSPDCRHLQVRQKRC